MVKVSKYSINSEHRTIIRRYYSSMIRGSDSQVYYKVAVLKSSKNFTEKNLCISLFLNKVPGLWPETFFRKGSSKGVFLRVLSNILEHLFCKSRLSDCFCKTSFCLSRQPQPQNVTIDLVFFHFTLNIFRANTSFF